MIAPAEIRLAPMLRPTSMNACASGAVVSIYASGTMPVITAATAM